MGRVLPLTEEENRLKISGKVFPAFLIKNWEINDDV